MSFQMDFKISITVTSFSLLVKIMFCVLLHSTHQASANMGHFFVIRHPERSNLYREQKSKASEIAHALIVNTTHCMYVSTYGFTFSCPR